jgi:hypothetical protein
MYRLVALFEMRNVCGICGLYQSAGLGSGSNEQVQHLAGAEVDEKPVPHEWPKRYIRVKLQVLESRKTGHPS